MGYKHNEQVPEAKILPDVTEIVREHLGLKEGAVPPESDLVDDLNADSLDQIELIMFFEEHFSIEIAEDQEIEKVKTVKDCADLVGRYLALAGRLDPPPAGLVA